MNWLERRKIRKRKKVSRYPKEKEKHKQEVSCAVLHVANRI